MKKIMFVVFAAAGLVAAAADVQDAKADVAARREPAKVVGGRAMPHRGGFGGDQIFDPSVNAVMNPVVAEKVGISEEVRGQLKTLDADARAKLHAQQQKVGEAVKKQSKLLKESKPDEAAVMAAIDEVSEARRELAKIQAKRVISVKALVTAEQLEAAFKEMSAQYLERRNRWSKGARQGTPKAPAAVPAVPAAPAESK